MTKEEAMMLSQFLLINPSVPLAGKENDCYEKMYEVLQYRFGKKVVEFDFKLHPVLSSHQYGKSAIYDDVFLEPNAANDLCVIMEEANCYGWHRDFLCDEDETYDLYRFAAYFIFFQGKSFVQHLCSGSQDAFISEIKSMGNFDDYDNCELLIVDLLSIITYLANQAPHADVDENICQKRLRIQI